MEEKKTHKFLNYILFIIVLIASIVLYSRYIGIKGLIVKEYRVESQILTKNFSGLKIVHFTDLLYKSTVDEKDLEKLINKINVLAPDIIVFTGDLVTNVKTSEKDKEILIKYLSKLDSKIGKYAIYGDHDYMYDDFKIVMEESDFIILNNEYDTIYNETNDPMYIVGLPTSSKEEINLEEAFKFYNEEDRKYIITLIHDGKTIDKINEANYEVDLILGGHSLNGSVIVPFYGPLFIDDNSGKYFEEKYTKGITNIFISSGIGTDKYNFRFNNRPSFNLYRLKSQS